MVTATLFLFVGKVLLVGFVAACIAALWEAAP